MGDPEENPRPRFNIGPEHGYRPLSRKNRENQQFKKKKHGKKSKGKNSQTAAVGNLNFFRKNKGPSATS